MDQEHVEEDPGRNGHERHAHFDGFLDDEERQEQGDEAHVVEREQDVRPQLFMRRLETMLGRR